MQITIYSKPNCVFCDKAKYEIDARNLDYSELNVTVPEARAELLQAVPDAKTVPQIFFDNRHIGGYDDMIAYFEGNKNDT